MKQTEFSKKYILDLESKIPAIIEYFVAYFGEKYRSIIVERLENMVLLFTCSNAEFLRNSNNKLTAEEVENYKAQDQDGRFLVKSIMSMQRQEVGAIINKIENLLNKNHADFSKNDLNFLASKIESSFPGKYQKSLDSFVAALNILLLNSIYEVSKDTVIYKGKTIEECFETIAGYNASYLEADRDSQVVCADSFTFLEKLKSEFFPFDWEFVTIDLSFFDSDDAYVTPKTSHFMDTNKKARAVLLYPYISRFLKDNIIIHELVHVVETGIRELENGKVVSYSGFNSCIKEVEGRGAPIAEYDDKKLISLSIVNEIFTDRCAIEIAYLMKRDGFEIIDNSQILASGYSDAFDAFEPLFKRFGDKLFEYKMNGKVDEFVKLICEQNLYDLAEGTGKLMDASDAEFCLLDFKFRQMTGRLEILSEKFIKENIHLFEDFEDFPIVKGYKLTNEAVKAIIKRLDEKQL